MTRTPWAPDPSGEGWEHATGEAPVGLAEAWGAEDEWAPEQWSSAESWTPAQQWALPDQWASPEDLAGLDEGHAVGEEERGTAEPEESSTGAHVLELLLEGEAGSVTSRLSGLAALAVGPALRRGSSGAAVVALQRVLTDVGLPLAADGDFGARTDTAVRAFQSRSGLTPDGVVGLQTKVALARALATRTPPGPVPAPAPPAPAPPAPAPPAPGPGADWSRVPAEQRMRYVMGLLVTRYGYPVNGAAGLVGNLWAESGLIPSRLEGSRPETPMRAQDASRAVVDFTPEQVRDRGSGRGPRLPGVGLAQWTWGPRRQGLFQHAFQGQVLGTRILFDMDAQVDYLVDELRRAYPRVDALLRRPDVSVDDACDEVLYRFETPGSVLGPDRRLLPRPDPRVQAVFAERRRYAQRALASLSVR